jgi:hypothetical protein
MPQIQLPVFPVGSTHITNELAVKKESRTVFYFNGSMPVFSHDEDDLASFRMITSQFCVNSHANQSDIVKVFGVTAISVKRSVELYCKEGPKGFYKPRETRGGPVLTPTILDHVQTYLNEGHNVAEIAQKCHVKKDTIKKAIQDGRLIKPTAAEEKKLL